MRFVTLALLLGGAAPFVVLPADAALVPPIIEVLVDDGSTLDVEGAWSAYRAGRFTRALNLEPSFGLGRRVLWVALPVDRVEDTSSTYALHLGFPRPDVVELLTVTDGVIKTGGIAGMRTPPERRAVPFDLEHVLPLTPPTGLHLLRVEVEPARPNLRVGTERAFAAERSVAGLAAGLYYGVFVGLFCFNLLFGLGTRDGAHLLYCVFLLCIAMQIAVRDGWLPERMPEALFMGSGLAITSLASLAFTRRFLRIESGTSPRWARAFSLATAAAVLCAVPPAFGVTTSKVALLVSLVNTILMAAAGVAHAVRGDRSAQLLVLAWAALLSMSALAMLHALGVVNMPWVGVHGVRTGAAAEMVLLALALAARVGVLREAKEAAEAALRSEAQRRQDAVQRTLVEAEERERRRLARELHDGIGHALLVIKQRAVRGQPVEPQVQSAIDEVRAIARALMPVRLQESGMADALAGLAADLGRATVHDDVLAGGGSGSAIDVDVVISADAEVRLRGLGDGAVHVYRIIQEAMANAARHGRANTIGVTAVVDGGRLLVRVDDDGVGLGQLATSGTGLASMRQRARLLGGALRVGARLDGWRGASVELTVPPAQGVIT